MAKLTTLAMVTMIMGPGLVTMAQAETIGQVTALQTSVLRSGKALTTGAPISLGDKLNSNETGLGVILFRDQSSAKIGPNSTLTIDEFVFSGNGSSSVRMDRGITRFFGGKISKKGRMQISTPHVVLATRGGIIDVGVTGGQSIATLRAGKLTCSNNGKSTVITRPGMSCVSDGSRVSVQRGGGDFSILDSVNKVAGTNEPGTKGPDLATDAPCSRPSAYLQDECQSRDGQLPRGTNQGGSNGTNPPLIGDDYYNRYYNYTITGPNGGN